MFSKSGRLLRAALRSCVLATALLLGCASAQTIEFGVGALMSAGSSGTTVPVWLRMADVRTGLGTASLGLRFGAVSSVSLDISANRSFGPVGNVVFEASGALRTDSLAEAAVGARGVLGPVAVRAKVVAFSADVAEFRPDLLAGAHRPQLTAPSVGLQVGVTARFSRDVILDADPEAYLNRDGVALRLGATMRLLRTFGDNELQVKLRAYSPPGLSQFEGALGVGLLLPRGRAPDWSLAVYLGAGPTGLAPGAEVSLAEQFGSSRVNLRASFEPYRLDVDPLRVSLSARTPLSGLVPGAPEDSGSVLEFMGALSLDPFANRGLDPRAVASRGQSAYLGIGVTFPF